VDAEKKRVVKTGKESKYADDEFGEGISVLNDTCLIEMTWLERKMHILDRESLQILETKILWTEVKEGWGITLDEPNRTLYVTDGSDTMTVVNSETLEVIRTMGVTKENGSKVKGLNELEFIYGYVWANLFGKNSIVKIDP
jgi:glutamine cyclotransferase